MSINHLITFVSGACVGGYLAYTYMEAVKDEQLRKERQEKRQVANRCLYVLKYGSDLYPETSSEDSITEQPTGHTGQSTEHTGQTGQQEQLLSDNDTLNTSSEVKSDTTLSNKFGLYVSTNSFPVHAILGYSDVNSYEPTILKKDTIEPTPAEPTPVQPTPTESTAVEPTPIQTSFAPVSTSEEKTSLLTTIQHNQSTLLSTPVEPTPTMATPSSTSTEIQSNAQKLESEEKAHTIYLMALEKLTR